MHELTNSEEKMEFFRRTPLISLSSHTCKLQITQVYPIRHQVGLVDEENDVEFPEIPSDMNLTVIEEVRLLVQNSSTVKM